MYMIYNIDLLKKTKTSHYVPCIGIFFYEKRLWSWENEKYIRLYSSENQYIFRNRKAVVCPIIDVLSDQTFEYITG